MRDQAGSSQNMQRLTSRQIELVRRVNGYFKDVVLTEQSSVQDSRKSVKAILDEAGVTIKRFVRFEVGASS